MKKIIIAIILLLLAAICVGTVFAMAIQSKLEYSGGMFGVLSTKAYQNDMLIADHTKADFRYDIKKVYRSLMSKRLVDYANGYYINVPVESTFDFKLSSLFVKVNGSDTQITISKEYSPYDDVMYFIDYYNNRFIPSPSYHQQNNMTLHEDTMRKIGNRYVRIISLTRTPGPQSPERLNTYTCAYIMVGGRDFYRILIKSEQYNKKEVENIIKSFTVIPQIGKASMNIDYGRPEPSPNWNDETKALYSQLVNREDIMWGVYTHRLIMDDGMSPAVLELEDKLEHKFELVMGYTYLSMDPPILGMQQAYEQGKITELTVQVSSIDNANLDGENPNFEVLDGEKDEVIRQFARKLRDFGHPFLFRLNNEMNTDWTSYAGVATLWDPEIYVKIFNKFQNIFEQEGVDNAIWIFNPQYGDFPPMKWNNYNAYYPGNIHLLGVTAYNTGTYYQHVYGEQWNSFYDLYDGVNNLYSQYFDQFPWVITEFASSSIGGDKAGWIDDMFRDIKRFPRIKAAVWFNFADYNGDEIARPYFLDETPETLEAFKRGLKGGDISPPTP